MGKRNQKKREPRPDLSGVSDDTREVYFVYRDDLGWSWWEEVCRIASEKYNDDNSIEDKGTK